MGYRGKTLEQQQARVLRTEGMTVPDIAVALGVAKSSVALWVRDVPYQPGPRRLRPPRPPNKLQRAKEAEIDALVVEGRSRIGQMTEGEFLVAGTALYAGEGAKRDGAVIFANTDARMVALFCAWLRHFFVVDEQRLRVRVYLHIGLDLESAEEYWSAVTGVPRRQFGKPYRATSHGGLRNNRHENGCVYVRYGCSRTHRSIMGLSSALLSSEAIPG